MSDERVAGGYTCGRIEPPRMSLWQIDEGLAAMLEYRQQRCDDTEAPPDAEELAAIDGQIAMYMEALPRKVDSTANVFRWWSSQLDTILGPKDAKGTRRGGEVDRLKGMAKAIEGQIERLKECCAVVLEKQPLPAKGSRALSGTTSKILLKTNGGLEPLVTNLEMLPPEYVDVTVRMSLSNWQAIQRLYVFEGQYQAIAAEVLSTAPANARIRAALADKCKPCWGMGEILPSGPSDAPVEICEACGGTGKAAVPGAHLEPRGAHVEIR